MYELKIIGKVFTSKSVWTGPSSYGKRIYRAAVSQKVQKHCSARCTRPAPRLPKTPASTSSAENHMQ